MAPLKKYVRAGLIAPVVFSLAILTSAPVFADSADETPIPDLVGVWAAVAGSIIFWDHGTTEFGKSHQITIDATGQEGPLLKATMTYRITAPDVQAHDGTKLTRESSEPMIGVVGLDGKSVSFADTSDVGFHHAVLVDPNTLTVTTLESGEHALAGRILMKRKP